ncbi:hypothetical protein L0337_06975 [candidate division KSB1 bacterium]|nr:hypothetical protein [candidate division KSB1 bacterium]
MTKRHEKVEIRFLSSDDDIVLIGTVRLVLALFIFTAISFLESFAQKSTVYASVVAKRGFVIGAANPRAGLTL